jgi:hypothetical protein
MPAISLPQFHLIRKMLRSQVRHVDIARELNLSVWTISRIHADLRRQGGLLNTNPARQRGSADSPYDLNGVGSQLRHSSSNIENGSPQWTPDPLDVDLPEDDAPPDYVATNLRRCKGCGGMVYQWPCLTCRLRVGRRD